MPPLHAPLAKGEVKLCCLMHWSQQASGTQGIVKHSTPAHDHCGLTM